MALSLGIYLFGHHLCLTFGAVFDWFVPKYCFVNAFARLQFDDLQRRFFSKNIGQFNDGCAHRRPACGGLYD